ncbi:unnamed protein product, partial [Scytosiphon promiscuus]
QCTNQNLELFSKALYPIRYLASLYLFIAGCIIAGNIHLAQGFGRGMTAIGAFLIVCCFWNFGSATLMHAGMKRHNKCIILSALLLDFLLAGTQLTLGSSIYSRTLPEYDESFQLDCLLKVPVTNSLDECLEYTRSDRYAGMMLVWRSYNYLSLDYTKYYQRLVTIEQDGVCCGFGPPTRCTGDSRGFPSYFSEDQVGFSTDRRYVCGPEENWYDSNYFCSQYVDETAVFLEIGGCKYDYPMGQCMDIDVDVLEGARGCAFELEMHMIDKVTVHALAIMGLSALMFASMLAGCCMFWKRAYDDSMPDHVDSHVPWDPFKDKGLLGESKETRARRARREGEADVKLDPLGVLIVGKMPGFNEGKNMPI